MDATTRKAEDGYNQMRLESLLAVDRAVGEIVDTLEANGLRERTLVVFTSDNGLCWGEHRQVRKGIPYLESIRVPLVISHPSLQPRQDDHLVAMNLDLGATVLDLAGLEPAGDESSLLPLLAEDPPADWPAWLPIQGWPTGIPVWAGVVTADFQYAVYDYGDEELYVSADDPWQERSRHADPAYEETRAALAALTAGHRGLAITTATLPVATRGESYTAELPAWGGTAPYSWEIGDGVLPAGLQLQEDGRVQGTPTEAGAFEVEFVVRDSSVSDLDGRPQIHGRAVLLDVLDSDGVGCACGQRPASSPVAGAAWLLGLLALRRREPKLQVAPSCPLLGRQLPGPRRPLDTSTRK